MFRNEFERENVKHFVETTRGTLWSRKTLKSIIPLLLFFSAMMIFWGIVEHEEKYEVLPGLILGMMIVIIIIYLIWTGRKEETYASRFVSMGLGATALSVMFFSIGISSPDAVRSGEIKIGVFMWVYIFFFLIIFGGTLYGIKKDWYRPRVSKFQRAKQIKKTIAAAGLGAVVGALVLKRFIDNLESEEKEKIIAYLSLIVAIVLILGITNFLRAYYVKKYGFTDPYEDGWYKPKRRKLKEAENEESEIEGEKSK